MHSNCLSRLLQLRVFEMSGARFVNNRVELEDLKVFAMIVRKGSLAGAAREMGLSPAYVTKRLQILETLLQTRLLHRSTRKMALTEDGERSYQWTIRILSEMDQFIDDISSARVSPRGLLNISCAVGFGPNFIAPAVSALRAKYPELEIRFEIFDRPIDLISEGFDIDIVQGERPPPQHIARRLVSNVRVLCASPDYVRRHGVPKSPAELRSHECLVIKSREHAFGVWSLNNGSHHETIKVHGTMSSNSGEVVLQWGLDGWGILLRSYWRVKEMLADGRLVRILPEWEQEAHVWASYPVRLANSAKLRVCVEFLAEYLSELGVPEP